MSYSVMYLANQENETENTKTEENVTEHIKEEQTVNDEN